METAEILDVTLLYVEDEASIRESLTRFIRRRITNLHVAENGLMGLKLFHEVNPDLIVTDIRMPEMDGLEMASFIRSSGSNVPIIVTTGHNDEEYFLRAIDIGIDKYLKKPVNAREFIDVVAHFARNALQEKEIALQNQFINTILDINPLHMMITNGTGIRYMNRSMLSFLGFSSFESFSAQHTAIDPFIVAMDDKPVPPFVTTIGAALANPANKQILYMRPGATENILPAAFQVRIDTVPGHDEYLVTFSDVTQLEKEKQMYHSLANQDFLTKLANRKRLDEELIKETERVNRYRGELSLIMFDVDFFKKVNDTYGHPEGDKVLVGIANTVQAAIRKTDTLARFGGEEFLLLMPETGLTQATELAERLREEIEKQSFGVCGTVTCSFGVTAYTKGELITELMKRVDTALYQAKHNGRNRVETIVSLD